VPPRYRTVSPRPIESGRCLLNSINCDISGSHRPGRAVIFGACWNIQRSRNHTFILILSKPWLASYVTKSSSKKCPSDTGDILGFNNAWKIDLEAIAKLFKDLKFTLRVPQVVKQKLLGRKMFYFGTGRSLMSGTVPAMATTRNVRVARICFEKTKR
jgi:hypothetical protein